MGSILARELLRPTPEGRAAISEIGPAHQELADRLAAELGLAGFHEVLEALHRLSAALDGLD